MASQLVVFFLGGGECADRTNPDFDPGSICVFMV